MNKNQFKTKKLKCKLLLDKNDLINKKIKLKYIFNPQFKFIYKETKNNDPDLKEIKRALLKIYTMIKEENKNGN